MKNIDLADLLGASADLAGMRPRGLLNMADLFCGAGGGSLSAKRAAALAGYGVNLTAINHWEVAVVTHAANFPTARHLCTGIDNVNPYSLYKPGELFALFGGPECIEFSSAAASKPKNYQYRPTPWCMVKWAEALRPMIVLIENVPEFERKWPPFLAWIAAFEALGYKVSWRTFKADKYGDATDRKRLFIQCMREPLKITWPDATHGDVKADDMFAAVSPIRTARHDVIDWKIQGRWLDEMPGKARYGGLPLSPKTLSRIFHGLNEQGLCPIIAEFDHASNKKGYRRTDQPLSTVTSKARHGLAEPYLVKLYGTGKSASIDKSFPSIPAQGTHFALLEPRLIHTAHGGKRRSRSVDEPLPTVTGNRGDMALCEFLLPQGGGGKLRSVDQPAPTVHGDGIGLVSPFLVQFNGKSKSISIDKPLPTVTTRDRLALLCPEVRIKGKVRRVRIRWRMLQWHEYAAAQGFPADYQFFGLNKRDRKNPKIERNGNKGAGVKQIGNAWPHHLGTALFLAIFTQQSDIRPFLAMEGSS